MPKAGAERNETNRKSHWRCHMAQTVADLLWEMLEKAGVQRC
jgi:hypothetical protein